MSRIAYVNGRYVRHAEAEISIDDRAVNFGAGVYEVCEVRGGALIDEARHMARLARSLAALRIAAPVGEAALRGILREVAMRNRVRDGVVYLKMKGACSGCPSSTATLRSGIQNLLRHFLPDVQAVEQIEA